MINITKYLPKVTGQKTLLEAYINPMQVSALSVIETTDYLMVKVVCGILTFDLSMTFKEATDFLSHFNLDVNPKEREVWAKTTR